MTEDVVVEISGERARIELNRPEKLNALNLRLVSALVDAAERVAAAPGVALVVVSGRGRSFCAGLDLDMFAAEGMSGSSTAARSRRSGCWRRWTRS